MPILSYDIMIKKFLGYITFWKKDESDNTANFNLKMMHKINKISIFMFIMAVIVLLVRYLFA